MGIMEKTASREIRLTDKEKILQEFFADERKANEERHGGVYEKDPFCWALFTSEQKAQEQRAYSDGDEVTILGNKVKFFDIHSTKAKQFGFTMYYGEDKLTCCGDEPYNEVEKEYVQNSTYLLHEAFCLYEDREKFHPYEKHHSTVKDACILAEELNVKNLILYHTEDKNITDRKELYTKEGKEFYSGNLYVPDDLEVFNL